MTDKGKWGSRELTIEFLNFYNEQVSLLEELYQLQFGKFDSIQNNRLCTIYPLLFSIHQTGVCINILASQGGYLNACYILGRAFIEKSSNYIYIIFCDQTEFSRYVNYTMQKGVRSQHRTINIKNQFAAELSMSGYDDLLKRPEIEKVIRQFTSQKGKPITRWTSKRLEDMLVTISENGHINVGFLAMAILEIYEKASESLHGTIYGALYDSGIFEVPSIESKTQEDMHKMRHGQFNALFLILGLCVHTLLQAVDKTDSINDILFKSKNNIVKVQSLFSQLH